MKNFDVEARDGDIVVTFFNNDHIKLMMKRQQDKFMEGPFENTKYKQHAVWGWLGEWATALAMGVGYSDAARMCLDEDGSKVDLDIEGVRTQVKMSLKESVHAQYHPNLHPAHYSGTMQACDAVVWGFYENVHPEHLGYKGKLPSGKPAPIQGIVQTDESDDVRVVLRNVALLNGIDSSLIISRPSGYYTCKWFGDVAVDAANTDIFGGVR